MGTAAPQNDLQAKYLEVFKQNAALMQENERLRQALSAIARKAHRDDPAWGIAQVAMLPEDFCRYCGGDPLPGQHARQDALRI